MKIDKNLSIIATIIFVVVVFTLGRSTQAGTSTSAAGATPVQHLSEDERDGFMQSCTETTDQSACQCMLDYIDSHYSRDQIQQVGNQSTREILKSDMLVNAVEACYEQR